MLINLVKVYFVVVTQENENAGVHVPPATGIPQSFRLTDIHDIP